MPATPRARKRLTFEFPYDTWQRLESLVKRTDSSSQAEVVRKALALLEVATEAREDGKFIGVASKREQLDTELVGI